MSREKLSPVRRSTIPTSRDKEKRLSCTNQGQLTRESGKEDFETGSESRLGWTELFMKGCGRTIERMGTESSFM